MYRKASQLRWLLPRRDVETQAVLEKVGLQGLTCEAECGSHVRPRQLSFLAPDGVSEIIDHPVVDCGGSGASGELPGNRLS
jgi:hypothetical protein